MQLYLLVHTLCIARFSILTHCKTSAKSHFGNFFSYTVFVRNQCCCEFVYSICMSLKRYLLTIKLRFVECSMDFAQVITIFSTEIYARKVYLRD